MAFGSWLESYRGATLAEVVRKGAREAMVTVVFRDGLLRVPVYLRLAPRRLRGMAARAPIQRADHRARVPVFVFAAETLLLREAGLRRFFFRWFSTVSPAHAFLEARLARLLRMRREVLRRGARPSEVLFSVFRQHAEALWQERRRLWRAWQGAGVQWKPAEPEEMRDWWRAFQAQRPLLWQPLRDRFFWQEPLSRGEGLRAGARLLIRASEMLERPPLWLWDEVLAELDSAARRELLQAARRYAVVLASVRRWREFPAEEVVRL